MSKTNTDVDHSIKYYLTMHYKLKTLLINLKKMSKYESTSPEHIKHTNLLIKILTY